MRDPEDDIHEPRRRTHWPKDYVESRERNERRANLFGACETILLTALVGLAVLGILGLLT
ncbi:MAG: hypothetical protein ABTQ31_10190 [Rhizobiaceae bacterium]